EAVILRYLEGYTQEEAARRVGCEQSALAKRAAAGLERLRSVLERRGTMCSLAVIAALLTREASAAAPPAPTVSTGAGPAGAGSRADAALRSRRVWIRRLALTAGAAGLVLLLLLLAGKHGSNAPKPAPTWQAAGEVAGHYAAVTCLTFSPDGSLLAS